MRAFWIGCLSVCFAAVAGAAPLVVETEPLSPEQQRAQFHLPPGFEIQLVASEPDIGQPMNLNFDAAGRLWVTSSVEYPYPVEGEGVQPRDGNFQGMGKPPARDRVTVIEGIGRTGKPARVSTFVSGLNIPIGQVPVPGGAIVFSIPDIQFHQDTDGDGKADKSSVLYGRFGNLDTHGMANSFSRGLDGWIYACHGFRNTSTVKGADGHEFTMNSGNTFRFRPDGQRIEQWTWGQVNPFGMAFDTWGNLYNADCHSKPITMLLRGATYDSFGKPHDGLGYGPDMIDHNHGSTGICGVAFYQGSQFPADYAENVFICNPVNGQVHRDKLVWTGATPKVATQPEFITCDDGWFRPVDVKLGPDGALYVADFYNAIIGHYEVPLAHPRRDREKGRIWRIVYTGEGAGPSDMPNIAAASIADLRNALASSNLTVRSLATDELVARAKGGDDVQVDSLLSGSETQQAHAVWILQRTGQLSSKAADLAASGSALTRAHLARALAEESNWTDAIRTIVNRLAGDAHPQVRLAAVEAIGRHPNADSVGTLLELLEKTDRADTHLVHSIRIALRNHLNEESIVTSGVISRLARNRSEILTDILLATTTPAAADLLAEITLVPTNKVPAAALTRIARYADEERVQSLIRELQKRDLDLSSLQSIMTALKTGLDQRGGGATEWMKTWAHHVARNMLSVPIEEDAFWNAEPLPGSAPSENPFVIQKRASADGIQDGTFYSSLPKGEQRTGILRTRAFICPEELTFWMAGHNGFPGTADSGKNIVRLRTEEDGKVVRQQAPPRNDMAQQTVWNLKEFMRKKVVFEIVDGDTGNAYAWLAVGRFSVPNMTPGDVLAPVEFGCDLVAEYNLDGVQEQLTGNVLSSRIPLARRRAMARALLAVKPDARLSVLLLATADAGLAAEMRERCFQAFRDPSTDENRKLLESVIGAATLNQQRTIADILASDLTGGETLFKLIEAGRLSPAVLQNPTLIAKLKQLPLSRIEERVTSLTKDLPTESEALATLIAQRKQSFESSPGNVESGKAVFTKNCSACHQIGTVGQRVGPQLDGVGIRGIDRLLEDVLAPNRNVDAAFRSSTIVLTSGKVLTGLQRRVEGDSVVFADVKGQEFRVVQSEIEEQATTPLSLMPANVAETIPEAEFRDLMTFLLSQKTGEGR